ncbi:diacylglycerol kinase family lipid kinase [Mariniflexile litorale]|uniref:Diacylglycerol kinase family lipid kinase n=1 Tax=Mariniflexile litorale TaxID=3045158 RepID=A0AAU7EF47_9FLAO|nr:diacylglycerol kinase family lipid kinase [Mariniflexile sp. KMM 9835]MDQ8211608.1 diacylglycerol kinase family lipid kinase [Mariniflexile sp. KMM 9835]
MKQIHFILNPIAGKGNNNLDLVFLNKYFNKKDFTIVVKPTHYKKHAIKLTQESIKENADVIVACGGDGTIHEVASCLVNSPIVLGIIPIGSGNGLASNLDIPKNLNKALTLIKNQAVKQIDVGLLNNHYFFSNTGIGFDAQVIKQYEASNERTLSSYIKATLKSLKKVNKLIEVETAINGKTIQHKPFLIFISNSNQMGYHVSLTPKASLQDGKLDILIVKKIGAFKIFLFTLLMFLKCHHILKEVTTFQSKNIKITQKNRPLFQIQIDGEFLMIKNHSIEISILEKALNVIAR